MIVIAIIRSLVQSHCNSASLIDKARMANYQHLRNIP